MSMNAVVAAPLPGLQKVHLKTECNRGATQKPWIRWPANADDGLPLVRLPNTYLVFDMPAFDEDDKDDPWYRVHLYLLQKPIHVVLKYKSQDDSEAQSKYFLASNELITLLMDALVKVEEHPLKSHLGSFCFALTSRIVDTVNADPYNTYVNLAELPFVPPQFFFQISDQGASWSEAFKLLRRLVTYPLLVKDSLKLRWGGNGRYLEACSFEALISIFECWKYSPLKQPHKWLMRLRCSGLYVNVRSDGRVRIWSPLLIRTRPDLMYYMDYREDARVRSDFTRWKRIYEHPVIASTKISEPDWDQLPAPSNSKIGDELLEKYYVVFKMFDTTMCEIRFVGTVPLEIEPDDEFYTSEQGFEMEVGYWTGTFVGRQQNRSGAGATETNYGDAMSEITGASESVVAEVVETKKSKDKERKSKSWEPSDADSGREDAEAESKGKKERSKDKERKSKAKKRKKNKKRKKKHRESSESNTRSE